ncbi:hypothetical protein [Streptomyces sp. NPDC048411]|uniref:hypothetical protein n=1 Tax=Streptomyces sp. NPDC048411 TaxID=3157206 RepID=UPI003451BC6E
MDLELLVAVAPLRAEVRGDPVDALVQRVAAAVGGEPGPYLQGFADQFRFGADRAERRLVGFLVPAA